jgi:hypothetical protein
VRLALLALSVAACSSTVRPAELRRPLVTDQTPLGMGAVDAARWFAGNGWCVDDHDGAIVRVRLCDRTLPPVWTELTFDGGRLVRAEVFVSRGPGRQRLVRLAPPNLPPRSQEPRIGVQYEPGPGHGPYDRGPSYVTDDDTDELLDALAVELEARYGQPRESGSGRTRTWFVGGEYIVLYVHADGWIVESHTLAL